jgi:hypothetical protein
MCSSNSLCSYISSEKLRLTTSFKEAFSSWSTFSTSFNNIVSLSISIICLHLSIYNRQQFPKLQCNANLYPPDIIPFYPPMGSQLKFFVFSFYKAIEKLNTELFIDH